MSGIADFDGADRWLVESALRKHYGEIIRVEPGDSEICLNPGSPEITTCPTYYWKFRDVEFVIFKIADNRYRSQFHYSMTEQFGSNRDFDDLADCVDTTLQAQSAYEKTRGAAPSGMTAAVLK